MTKGRIRHLALSVPDPWATAAFYKSAFGMTQVGETDSRLAEGVFLTDGVINLALLKFKDEEAAQGKGTDYVGLHHVGFWVDDVPSAGKDVSARHKKLTDTQITTSLRTDRSGQNYLRISPHFYNTDAELEQVLELLSA